jgi:hypothetical protein
MEHRRAAWLSVWLVINLLSLALSPAAAQAQAGGWEWQNPLPQGNWLYDVWGSSDWLLPRRSFARALHLIGYSPGEQSPVRCT